MADAIVRKNPDGSLCEIEVAGDTWGPLDATEGGHFLYGDEDEIKYYVSLSDDGLSPDTVYELTPIDTEIEEVAEIEEEDEDDEDEDDTVSPDAH